MSVRFLACLGFLALSALLAQPDVRAAGVGVSTPARINAPSASADTFLFFPLRPGQSGDRMFRDLEFSLSANYSRYRGDATPGLTTNDRTTLFNFAKTLVDTTANPFGAPYPDVWLVHDYFKGSGIPYEPNPSLGPGFLPPGMEAYPTADRSHIDHYIFEPGLDGIWGGRQSSSFQWEKEDSSTNHWSPSAHEILEQNSSSFPGPALPSFQDLSGTGWTRPDAKANWGTIHEIQHLFNNDTGSAMTEMFSTAAEVLTGSLPSDAAVYDVNYTWSLLDDFDEPAGSGVTHTTANYTAWRLFSAYLLTNFRNQDTTATLPSYGSGGLADDLMFRWARRARKLDSLGSLLANDSCFTCSQKAAFHVGSSQLSTHDRLNVLLHNWRVANFVNNPFLAPDADGHGMYGYPPQFGFSPVQDVGAWQDNDTTMAAYNVLVFPNEVTARPAWVSRDTVISVSRPRDGTDYPLRLRPLGSEYWVIRSTSSMPTGKQLVVRLAADSVYWRNSYGSMPSTCSGIFADWYTLTGNIMASLVGYSSQSDSLWDHPSWATTVVGPTSADIDSLTGELELKLPGFGDQYDAAVLVLTVGLGPFGALGTQPGLSDNFHEATRYRLNLALRDTSTTDVNPRALVQSSPTDDHPTWSPDGSEIVYSSATTPYAQLYRVAASGGTPSLLVGGSAQQRTPDWSPRGDYITYVESTSDTATMILRYRVEDPELEPLTSGTTQAVHPAFSPNGQRVAYARRTPGMTTWSLRLVNVDGTGDAALSSTVHANPVSSIRWSADGSYVYYVSGERLHGVPAGGGASTQRDGVVANLGSFDLPHGTSRILLEELGATRYFCDGVNNFVPYRRLAFRDTTLSPRDTEMRFYRTKTSFYSPRFSPDDRFVAYRSDQNSVGGGDLFIGQVIWDRAPTFNVAINDTSVWEGLGVTIDMRATDPDGDAVSYAGAFLPVGSSIVNGYFLWSNPTVTGAPHYVTLRALSPGGAVVSTVVKIDVIPRPVAVSELQLATGRYSAALAWTEPDQPGGEADSYEIRYLANSTINELIFATGTLVNYTEAPGPEGTEHCIEPPVGSCSSYSYAIRTIRDGVPSFISNVASGSTTCSGSSLVQCLWDGLYAGGGGGGSLRTGGSTHASSGPNGIRSSEASENSLLGGARGTLGSDLMLLPGDTGPDERTYSVRIRQSARNEVELDRVTLGAVDRDPSLEAHAGDGEVLLGTSEAVAAVRDNGGAPADPAGRSYTAGDALTVDLGVRSAALLLAASGPAVQAGGDSAGIRIQVPDGDAWRTVTTIYPRRSAQARAIDVEGATTVRLAFGSSARIESIRRLAVSARAQPTPLTMIGATHSRRGDVATTLASIGGDETTLARGEEIALAFATTEVPAGTTRTLFLGANGAHRATEAVTAEMATAGHAATPVSYAFSLGSAHPNPSTGRVTIEYSLAHPVPTRIQVYGVTGRLVRTLIDGPQEPGPHEIVWDGRTSAGTSAGPGVYFYRLEAGDFRSERKVVVTRP